MQPKAILEVGGYSCNKKRFKGVNMVFKRLLSLFVFLTCGTFANAQSLTTSIVVGGSTDSLTFNAAIAPTGEFLNNGSKLWMAIILGDSVYFFNDTQGFVPYAGGLRLLLSGSPAEAPAVRTITKSTEVVKLTGWNTRSILGSDVFIGYGASFAELVRNARYTKLYTFVEKAPAPTGLAALYGRLTLSYKFNNSSTVYTDAVNFSASNAGVSSGTTSLVNYIIGDPSRAIACAVLPDASYTHLCAIASQNGVRELFAFRLENGSITRGVYTYCSAIVSTTNCSTELFYYPDGVVVSGFVQTNVAPLSVSPLSSNVIAIEQSKAEDNGATRINSGASQQTEFLSPELSARFEALIEQAKGAKN